MPDTDILVTTSPGVTLVILVADCVPLALVDPAAGVLAAVHAGWRGTAAGAVARRAAAPCGAGAPARAGAGLPRAGRGPGPLPGLPTRCTRALARAVRPGGARRRGGPARRSGPLAGRPGRGQPPAAAPGRRPPRAHHRQRRHHGRRGASSATAPRGPAGRFALLARLARLTVIAAGGAVAWGGPAPGTLHLRCLPPDQFRYDGFAVDPAALDRHAARYSTGDHTFTERFTFGPGATGTTRRSGRRCASSSCWRASRTTRRRPPRWSTWATCPPRRPNGPSSRGYYVHGLGEFAYRNGLDLRGLAVDGPDAAPAAPVPYDPTPGGH